MNLKKKYILATGMMNVLVPACSMQAAAAQEFNEAAAIAQEEIKETAAVQDSRKSVAIEVPKNVLSVAQIEKEILEANRALLKAVDDGDLTAATAALNAGADINARNKYGRTPLIGFNDVVMVDFLIKNGAHVNVRDNDSFTPLLFYAKYDKADIVSLLIHKGADVNVRDKDGKTALMYTDNLAIAELLIKNGADVNARDNDGCTALVRSVTCYKVDTRMVSLLLRNGAEVNACDKDGKTPLLHYLTNTHALYNNSPLDRAVVELLINAGADVNAQDNKGYTPLRCAAFRTRLREGSVASNIATMQLLIDKGADVNARDRNGETPLIIATDVFGYCSLASIRLLVDNGADVNVQSNHGDTALGNAVRCLSFDREVVRFLLERATADTIEKVLADTPAYKWERRPKIKLLLQEELAGRKALEEKEAQRVQEEMQARRAQEVQRALEEQCNNTQAMVASAAQENNQEMIKWLVRRDLESAAEEKCAVCLHSLPELVNAQIEIGNVGEVCQHVVCGPCKEDLRDNKSLTCPLCRAYSGTSADLSLSWGDTAQLLLRPAMWGRFKQFKQIQQLHKKNIEEFHEQFKLFRPSFEYLKQQFNAQRQEEEVKDAAQEEVKEAGVYMDAQVAATQGGRKPVDRRPLEVGVPQCAIQGPDLQEVVVEVGDSEAAAQESDSRELSIVVE